MKIELSSEIAKMPRQAQERIWKRVEADVRLGAELTVANVAKRTPSGATSQLRGGIKAFIRRAPNRVIADIRPTGMGAKYAEAVERGTKPHWVKPMGGLLLWAKRVLGDEKAGWAVRMRIAGKVKGKPGGTSIRALRKHGTWGYKMFKRGAQASKPKVINIIRSGIKDSLIQVQKSR